MMNVEGQVRNSWAELKSEFKANQQKLGPFPPTIKMSASDLRKACGASRKDKRFNAVQGWTYSNREFNEITIERGGQITYLNNNKIIATFDEGGYGWLDD